MRTGISAQPANGATTNRETVMMMLSVLKIITAEAITAEISGVRLTLLLIAVFQVNSFFQYKN